MKICKANLDKKVNEEETLRYFIKDSYNAFYGKEITDKEIDSWSEERLIVTVEHFDYLWEK